MGIGTMGIGIVIGVVGVAIFIGLVKFINWCGGVSIKYDQLELDFDMRTQRFNKRCLELDNTIKMQGAEMAERHVKHSEAILDAFVVLGKRVGELEKAEFEKNDEEKSDEDS